MTDWMEPATKIDQFTNDILDFCETDYNLLVELIQEKEKFLTKTPQKYYPTPDAEEMAELRFSDYFIYSYTSKHYKIKPIEFFISKMLHKYNQKDKERIKGFKNNIFSGFTISTVCPGFYFIVTDLSTEKEYKVRENQASFQLQENDYFIGRILPYESDYALSGINLFLPNVPTYTAKRAWKDLPTEISKNIDPLMIEREIHQKSVEDNNSGYDSPESIEIIEKRLRNYLKKHLGKKAPSIKSLRKKVNRITNPASLIKELVQKMHISSQEELVEFQQLFYDFWNNTPRDEFQGKSPEERAKGSMGPRENELLDNFMNYMKKNMDITKFSNKDELEEAIKDLQRKWLNEPQEELNGKTPFQTMKEEREEINSPRKDFPISFSIDPIDIDFQDLTNLNDITEEDSPVASDVEIFVHYFQENRIKVTQQNRWIPFKHLKLIEKNFINPGKDSFVFMGVEENRGEEKRKLYIHFIHLLSRAAKLIYHDEKGIVQVNHKKFKKFTKKRYGDKTIELMITWIEKVKWVELQPAEHVKPYAKEYQKKIVGLWHHFHQFKPNEKISSHAFIKELYTNIAQKGGEFEEIAFALTPVVNGILIRYLKWFGAVDIKEEKTHPKLEVWAIKEFWVTPKGKKLIDRIVMDFWEKGKIKMNE